MKFTEWLELREAKSSRTKSGKKVPGKYLSGLSEKGKHGSKEAMKKEIDQFRGKDEYKLDWDADYKHGKRIKTKKGKATKAFEKKFGKTNENNEEILDENVNKALENKAKKSGVSVGILRQVFNRGKAAWNSGHRPGVAQNQWAFGRVNSFLTGVGGARKADKDLWAKTKKRRKRGGEMKKFSEWLVERKYWIQDVIKKPGSLTKAAKASGKSIDDYCKNPPSSKAEKRCNLRDTLKGLKKKKN